MDIRENAVKVYRDTIELQNGKSYRFTVLEPAEFFLNRQLKKYHKQYK